MKELWRRIKMLRRLARRGAWYGVGRFSGTWVWGWTHTHCRRCHGPKRRMYSPMCHQCQMKNFIEAIFGKD